MSKKHRRDCVTRCELFIRQALFRWGWRCTRMQSCSKGSSVYLHAHAPDGFQLRIRVSDHAAKRHQRPGDLRFNPHDKATIRRGLRVLRSGGRDAITIEV